MARAWGSIRKVLLELASSFVEVNEDLEKVSMAKTKEAMTNHLDLFAQGYIYPQAELTIRCRATKQSGRIKLLGLKGVEEKSDSIEVVIRATIQTRPFNKSELEKIAWTEEEKIKEELARRGIEGVGGNYFIPDEEEPPHSP